VDRVQRRGAVILFGTAGVAYLFDRLTKLWAERALPGDPIDVVRGVLTLRFTTNSGGAFSFGRSAPWLFAGATIVVSTLIVVTAFRRRSGLSALALGLILGGALGNLTDRIARGAGVAGRVVDFVDLHVWPIFNVADTAIVVGAVLLAASSARSVRDAGDGSAGEGPDDDPDGGRASR
jgi:signal peptidase II